MIQCMAAPLLVLPQQPSSRITMPDHHVFICYYKDSLILWKLIIGLLQVLVSYSVWSEATSCSLLLLALPPDHLLPRRTQPLAPADRRRPAQARIGQIGSGRLIYDGRQCELQLPSYRSFGLYLSFQ